jgi:hypothetical protein
MRWMAAALITITLAGAARAEDAAPAAGHEDLRWIDPFDQSESYRSIRAGEGFRTRMVGRDVVNEPRDRRSTSAIDLGIGTWIPSPDGGSVLPFFSLYFWRRPDENSFLRATGALLYNEIDYAHSLAPESPFELVLGFENNTVPFDSSQWVDGEEFRSEELRKGFVRGVVGLGFRRQIAAGFGLPHFEQGVDPQRPDNQFAFSLTAEPKYLYFSERNGFPNFVVPQDTFELEGRAQLRWDSMERNLLDLVHRGMAVGFDGTYGWRANWENWGIDRVEQADRARHPALLKTYAVVATGIPGLNERHRWIQYLHAGWGWHLDRFSQPRIGGGPGGQEFLSLARPLLPGADISEFTPKHYAIAIAEYRYEVFFFTYLSARGGIAWLDRERFVSGNIFAARKQNDFLVPVGARISSGFAFRTYLQVDYNYNFDVIRERDRGGHEVVVHISRSF